MEEKSQTYYSSQRNYERLAILVRITSEIKHYAPWYKTGEYLV